jgi:putative glutamate/gamma-aminobutyrate antiporter
MINLAAIGTVKNWPVTAEFGFSSIFYLLLAAFIFLIPVSLIAAELSTGWTKAGGVFLWVKEAFGHRAGFLAIWLLWLENVLWYPTILSFIAATIAYLIDPALTDNKLFMMGSVLVLFWGLTLFNSFGIRISSWISTFGAIFGTFVAGFIIIALGAFWFFSNNPRQISFDVHSAIPSLSSPNQMVFFTGVILTLCGLEMSSIYAKDVENPQKNYPKAILLSVVLILGLSLLGVLSIAIVVPQKQISLVAGSLQAFSYFVDPYKMSWIIPCMAACIAIGSIGSLSTWMLGPCRGLLEAAKQGDLPPFFRKINAKKMPVNVLIIQGIIVTVLSFLFLLTPSVNAAYFMISVIVTQLYLIMYVMMFAAAIRLRYLQPGTLRTYKVPGGKPGMWVVAGIGILSCLFTFLVGFFPPEQIPLGNPFFYIGFLLIGIVLACSLPSFILLFQKEHWKHPLSHEKESL